MISFTFIQGEVGDSPWRPEREDQRAAKVCEQVAVVQSAPSTQSPLTPDSKEPHQAPRWQEGEKSLSQPEGEECHQAQHSKEGEEPLQELQGEECDQTQVQEAGQESL